jgi:hypothetical protein
MSAGKPASAPEERVRLTRSAAERHVDNYTGENIGEDRHRI